MTLTPTPVSSTVAVVTPTVVLSRSYVIRDVVSQDDGALMVLVVTA